MEMINDQVPFKDLKELAEEGGDDFPVEGVDNWEERMRQIYSNWLAKKIKATLLFEDDTSVQNIFGALEVEDVKLVGLTDTQVKEDIRRQTEQLTAEGKLIPWDAPIPKIDNENEKRSIL